MVVLQLTSSKLTLEEDQSRYGEEFGLTKQKEVANTTSGVEISAIRSMKCQ